MQLPWIGRKQPSREELFKQLKTKMNWQGIIGCWRSWKKEQLTKMNLRCWQEPKISKTIGTVLSSSSLYYRLAPVQTSPRWRSYKHSFTCRQMCCHFQRGVAFGWLTILLSYSLCLYPCINIWLIKFRYQCQFIIISSSLQVAYSL